MISKCNCCYRYYSQLDLKELNELSVEDFWKIRTQHLEQYYAAGTSLNSGL